MKFWILEKYEVGDSLIINMFPAKNGDSFLLELEDGKNILIDMGYAITYKKYIREKLIELNKKGQCLDLIVITHIDQDHIEGALEFFSENGDFNEPRIIEVKEIWHNSYRHLQFDKTKENNIDGFEKRQLENIIVSKQQHSSNKEFVEVSARQGSTLAAMLYSNGYEDVWNKSFNFNAITKDELTDVFIGETKITMLSPDNKKLKDLSTDWLKKLYEIDPDFKITDENIFDDAYEVYLTNQKKSLNLSQEREISYKELNLWNIIENDKFEQFSDDSKSNGSSIAFILESFDKKVLFLGDAHDDLLGKSLLEYKERGNINVYDAIKLSHHGSKKNNYNVIKYAESKRYLFSTDGKKHNHPDIETVAQILKKQKDKILYFTYKLPIVDELINDKLLNNYDVIFGNGEKTIRIEV